MTRYSKRLWQFKAGLDCLSFKKLWKLYLPVPIWSVKKGCVKVSRKRNANAKSSKSKKKTFQSHTETVQAEYKPQRCINHPIQYSRYNRQYQLQVQQLQNGTSPVQSFIANTTPSPLEAVLCWLVKFLSCRKTLKISTLDVIFKSPDTQTMS